MYNSTSSKRVKRVNEEEDEDVLSNLMKFERNYDLMKYNRWKDYSNRIIHLDESVDDDTIEYVNALYRWDREDDLAGIKPEDRQPVIMYINNYGGDIVICYALISAMKAYKGTIVTFNQSVACSAAALIFICGTKGHRYCTKYSFTLFHQGSGGSYGTYAQQEASQRNYQKMINMMEDIILSNTNIDQKTYKKICEKENYYYADDCIRLGVCDKVIESTSDLYEGLKVPKKKVSSKSTTSKKVKKVTK